MREEGSNKVKGGRVWGREREGGGGQSVEWAKLSLSPPDSLCIVIQ